VPLRKQVRTNKTIHYNNKEFSLILANEFIIFILFSFCTMVEEMTGEKLHVVWIVCWFVISPAILVTLIVLSLYDLANTEGYLYSTWQPSTVRINGSLLVTHC
jgi:hypothetical protein